MVQLLSSTKADQPHYTPDTFDRDAMETLQYERSNWNEGSVFITDRIAYRMRPAIRKARKYYLGIFDSPTDEITGENKTWVPLTEWSVDSVVKNVDFDTKDIIVEAGTPAAVGFTPLVKALLLNYLKKMGFGELLNQIISNVARDGTVVVKTYDDIDKRTGKRKICSYVVDLLNVWVDPSARSLQESSVVERVVMSQPDFEEFRNVWKNVDEASYSYNVPRVLDTYDTQQGKIPMTEVWERWGKIKKSWLTKDSDDDKIWIDGHMIASGLSGPRVMHLIRENPRKDGLKPYEEGWYKQMDGRWYGRGVAEMLFGIQENVNRIFNIRTANNIVLQNGIFLIRKGSGISPEMVSAISAGGGIPVTDVQKDIKQLQVQDFRQSSYTDEDRTYLLADRVTGAQAITRGELARASASATATLSQERNIKDSFTLIKENLGFFIERLIMRQYIPMLKKIVKEEDFIRITGKPEYLSEIDASIIKLRENDFIQNTIESTGFYPEQEEIDTFKSEQSKYLKGMGKTRFVNYFRNIFDEDIDIDIMLTEDRMNKIVAVQQLRDMLIAYSKLPVASSLNPDAILREITNLMGLKGEFFLNEPQAPTLKSGAQGPGRMLKGLPQSIPNEVTANENANKLPQAMGAQPSGMPPAAGAPPAAGPSQMG